MHPNETRLSLYAGGELNRFERFRTGLHLRACSRCRAKVESLERASLELRQAASKLPEGLNWDRLAAEMTGNIRVGLAAGECVAPVRLHMGWLNWRGAAALASATALIVTAWWLNIPPSTHTATAMNGIRLDKTVDGLQVMQNGRALVLLNQSANIDSTVFVSTPGSLRARYVNSKTGQMTITNVYAQ
jgi:anti-sigma factor RsiW